MAWFGLLWELGCLLAPVGAPLSFPSRPCRALLGGGRLIWFPVIPGRILFGEWIAVPPGTPSYHASFLTSPYSSPSTSLPFSVLFQVSAFAAFTSRQPFWSFFTVLSSGKAAFQLPLSIPFPAPSQKFKHVFPLGFYVLFTLGWCCCHQHLAHCPPDTQCHLPSVEEKL